MRYYKIFVGISSLLVLTACGSVQVSKTSNQTLPVSDTEKSIERVMLHGNFVKFDDEDQLNDEADLIVIASSSDSFLDREQFSVYSPAEDDAPETLSDVYSKNKIIIKEILKPDDNYDLNIGDVLEVIEPVAVVEENDEKQIISIENYLEMEEDINYIIYLGLNSYGEYSVINMNNGRFNIDGEDSIVNIEGHGHDNEKEEHEEFKEQVLETYDDELEDLD